jgi:predicted RNA polymerase sigma factor
MLRFFRLGVLAFEASEPHVQGFVAEADRESHFGIVFRALTPTCTTPVVTRSQRLFRSSRAIVTLSGLSCTVALAAAYLYHAARADLLRRLRRNEEAVAAHEQALSLNANTVERRYLRRRMAELSSV